MTKSRSVQADANKVSLMLKKINSGRWFCDFEEVLRWFENIIDVRGIVFNPNYIFLLTKSNKC